MYTVQTNACKIESFVKDTRSPFYLTYLTDTDGGELHCRVQDAYDCRMCGSETEFVDA